MCNVINKYTETLNVSAGKWDRHDVSNCKNREKNLQLIVFLHMQHKLSYLTPYLNTILNMSHYKFQNCVKIH